MEVTDVTLPHVSFRSTFIFEADGAELTEKAFGGKVLWSQLPAYLIGEFAGGTLGGLAWAAIGRVRADAAMTSLSPDPDPVAEKVSGATS